VCLGTQLHRPQGNCWLGNPKLLTYCAENVKVDAKTTPKQPEVRALFKNFCYSSLGELVVNIRCCHPNDAGPCSSGWKRRKWRTSSWAWQKRGFRCKRWFCKDVEAFVASPLSSASTPLLLLCSSQFCKNSAEILRFSCEGGRSKRATG
jgi:hypothetical protein